MENNILSPKVDVTFRLLFGDVRHTEILEDFLKATLDIPDEEYDHIEIDDTHILPDTADGKECVLDVRIHTKSGIIIEVEIQKYPQTAFRSRLGFYLSSLVTHQLSRGDDHAKLKRVITIAITDFRLIEESEAYHHNFTFYDEYHKVKLTDMMEIDVLELPKLPTKEDGTPLYNWLKFIGSEEENEMAELAEKNPKIKTAYAVLRELSEDEKIRRLAEAREKELRDRAAELDYARTEGVEKGVDQSKKALRYLKSGHTTEDAAKESGLPIEEVQQLAELIS
jgi:predicted transposase/invertase (TIGR01784 family)